MSEYYLQVRFSYNDCDSKSSWANTRWYTGIDDEMIEDQEVFMVKKLLEDLPKVKLEEERNVDNYLNGVVGYEYRIIKVKILKDKL